MNFLKITFDQNVQTKRAPFWFRGFQKSVPNRQKSDQKGGLFDPPEDPPFGGGQNRQKNDFFVTFRDFRL